MAGIISLSLVVAQTQTLPSIGFYNIIVRQGYVRIL
jgi:hypothetical protein